MKRYYFSSIVGSGVDDDPYRPRVADYPCSWAGSFPCGQNGTPSVTVCLCIVECEDFAPLDEDPLLYGLPVMDLDTPVSAMDPQAYSDLVQKVESLGLTAQADTVLYSELLESIGIQLNSAFSVQLFDVRGVSPPPVASEQVKDNSQSI